MSVQVEFLTRLPVRLAAMLTAIGVYAFWGSPTPDNPGVVEILIGVFLILAVSPVRLPAILSGAFACPAPLWRGAAGLLLLYGLTVPLMTGLLAGHSVSLILRDLLPFLFMLLPFFVLPFAAVPAKKFLTLAIAGAGFIFTMRVLGPFVWMLVQMLVWMHKDMPVFSHFWSLQDPAYLVNAPTVLFSALLLTGGAGWALYKGAGLRRLLTAALLLTLAGMEVYAMALIVQRATLGVMALFTLLLLGIAFVRAPRRAILPLLVLAGLVFCFWPLLAGLLDRLETKTMLVGVNMRWQEWQAVMDVAGRLPFSLLFGGGWGQTFASPAVGGMEVNYTHIFFGAMLLKTGVAGALLAALYLGALGALLVRGLFRNPVIILALSGPFLIDVFLYASYKSLDFGLVLLLIPLWAGRGEDGSSVASRPPL